MTENIHAKARRRLQQIREHLASQELLDEVIERLLLETERRIDQKEKADKMINQEKNQEKIEAAEEAIRHWQRKRDKAIARLLEAESALARLKSKESSDG